MEKEPQTPSLENRFEQNEEIQLLITGLKATDGGGYFRLSLSKDVPSEIAIDVIKKNIPNAIINTHRVSEIILDEKGCYNDHGEFLKWIFKIQKAPENAEKDKKHIFIVDLSGVPSEEGVDSYFAEMNMKRDEIAGNPNGPVLVITPILGRELERFIHGVGDLRSCCSGQYKFEGK